VRFLSCEPLIADLGGLNLDRIDWVIIGGESGSKARPMELEWVRSIVRQCRAQGAAPFVKQLGAGWASENGHGRSHGGDWDLWPEDLRIRDFATLSVTAAT
jgi:protein gp37